MLKRRPSRRNERGAMVVLFAVVLPLVLLLGVISVDVGNWWVHQKRAQTLVDAAVFASGTAFTGCALDPAAANLRIAQRALEYAGDTGRDGATRNRQEQQPGDLKIALNSTSYWNGSYPADNTMGDPCSAKFLDAKATDDDAPLLFGFIPVVADPHAHARVEIRQTQIPKGVLPFAVPEFDPVRVAALVVNEDISASNANSVVGKSLLNKQSLPPGDPLAAFNVWRSDLPGVNVNGNENFGVVVLASRDPNVSITGSLSTICNQNPVQTSCYAGGTSTSGLSFIHSYTNSGAGSASQPRIRQVELAGGCGQSGPYFNLDDDVSCNAILIQAALDFGATGNPTLFPTCARVTSTPGGAMTWSAGGVGGALGMWTASFVPAIQSGRREVDLSTQYRKPSSSDCSKLNGGPDFERVAAPYVANDASGVVKHVTVENLDSPFGFANSISGTASADFRVTVGFAPPLAAAALSDPPISLRIASPPGSQNQTVDCDGGGANGMKDAIENGCQTPYQVNQRNGSCSTPYPVPADCIAVATGDKTGPLRTGMHNRFANPCTPNNWDGVHLPPENDPRWIVLFITDEKSFTTNGKKTYPIRRFGGFYVTGADGMGCPGDSPPVVASKDVWGHFVSYVAPSSGGTPSDQLCDYDGAGACIAVLVE